MRVVKALLFLLACGSLQAEQRPVKIFILSGQSNMTGRGMLGDPVRPPENQQATLIRYLDQPENRERLGFLTNGAQTTETGWTIRDDVFITTGDWPHLQPGEENYDPYRKHGGLGPYYGGRGNRNFKARSPPPKPATSGAPRETHGGTGTAEHWNANGESYWLIGESMAAEMLRLLKIHKTD